MNLNYNGFVIVLFVALAAMPVFRAMFLRLGIVDAVDGDPLKIHTGSVALSGGAVVLLAMAAGSAVPLAYPAGAGKFPVYGIAAGALLMFVTGLWDDIKKLNPAVRLVAAAGAGALLVGSGISVGIIPSAWVSVPLSVFYIMGAVNSFNVIDGMDGLCTGVALVSCAGFFVYGLLAGAQPLAILSFICFLALLGFLPFNFHPAKVFLGNSGSALLGFLMGSMAVMTASVPCDYRKFAASVLLLGVPVFDMAFAIVRRAASGKALFAGDRGHLYDILLKKGLSQPEVWGVVCIIQALSVCAGLLVSG